MDTTLAMRAFTDTWARRGVALPCLPLHTRAVLVEAMLEVSAAMV